MTKPEDECCPRFDPQPWDGKTVTWEGRPFVQDKLWCLFHIPLNFGRVMRRQVARIEAAGMMDEQMIVLTANETLWSADVYISVAGDVPGSRMTRLSGTFLSKVFEGHYKEVPNWMRQMADYVAAQGRQIKRQFTYYTTCPKCAQKYGKNYVVLLAEGNKKVTVTKSRQSGLR
ncbi:MAG: hypothetical protein JW818_19995 [Pirellulales bacterium]|nr:hypothetical protein [Pirellulales bacterium]